MCSCSSCAETQQIYVPHVQILYDYINNVHISYDCIISCRKYKCMWIIYIYIFSICCTYITINLLVYLSLHQPAFTKPFTQTSAPARSDIVHEHHILTSKPRGICRVVSRAGVEVEGGKTFVFSGLGWLVLRRFGWTEDSNGKKECDCFLG